MVADLILLPGLLCDSRLWRQQTEGLSDAARCAVPDLTAHDTIAAMADAVLGVAPSRFALAGFSLGSCVALEVIARAPGRVARLALLSSAVHGLPEAVRRHYLESIPVIQSGGLRRYLADAFPRYVAPARAHDRALWEVFVGMGESLGPDVAVRQMKALLAYTGYQGDLAAIRCPTAVVCGAEDHRATPTTQAQLALQIPGASLRQIEGAGHFTPLEAPVAVSEALRDWLLNPSV
jgi:pimeloyl-ACP methyl ester carboxylesterase